jgi:hypothetical protein
LEIAREAGGYISAFFVSFAMVKLLVKFFSRKINGPGSGASLAIRPTRLAEYAFFLFRTDAINLRAIQNNSIRP